jgi:DNA/RNA endonuclease YhcR with UshA esterase domain
MAPFSDHHFAGAQMIKRALGFVVMFGALMAGASVQAHHSTAGIYDPAKEVTIKGALAKLQFVNPHGSITVTVKNADGTSTDWTFTTGSATALANRGITKVGPNALKIGEEVTVVGTPARNGSPLAGLKTLTRADGTVLGNEGGF